MHSDDIDVLVNKYWAVREQFVSDSEYELIDRLLDEGDVGDYTKPTKETPVPAKIFVCWLDTDFTEPILKKIYPRYKIIKHRLGPRVRFLAYFCLSREVYLKKAYRKLSQEDFYVMGFKSVPNYELLRVFIYEKIGRERLKSIFKLVIEEVKHILTENGIKLGERVGEDATDIQALKYDEDAEYSGYYKEYGYKIDIVHDLDQETLPIDYSLLQITDDEGKYLPDSKMNLEQIGIKPNEWKVDGKYPSYSNIAKLEIQSTHLIYKIQEDWIYNPKGTFEEIEKKYQTYHNYPDFKPTKDIEVMVSYLYKKEEYEFVGAFYRNQSMNEFKNNPKEYLSKCAERSGKTEGMISVIKLETALDTRLPKRGWDAFVFIAGISMLAFAFAALIKLQNGTLTHLGSLTYIT
jgi:hypothetical protein